MRTSWKAPGNRLCQVRGCMLNPPPRPNLYMEFHAAPETPVVPHDTTRGLYNRGSSSRYPAAAVEHMPHRFIDGDVAGDLRLR